MTTRHLIYGEFGSPRVAGHIVAALLAAIGVAMVCLEEYREAGVGFLSFALLLSISAEIYVGIMNRRQRWIEIHPDGFTVIDHRTGERELKDFEIVSLSYSLTAVLSNGRPNGYERHCRLWPASGPVIELKNKYAEGVTDPLADFIHRIGDLLREGFSQAMKEGVEVRGDGWSLDKSMFRCKVRTREEQLPVHKISAIGPYDTFMGVWVVDQEEPAASLPIDGRNVWLLPALIAPYLPKEDPNAPPPTGGLGRLIFRRKASLATAIVVAIAGLVMIPIGIIGVITPDELSVGYRLGAVGLVAFGLIVIGFGVHLATAEFRCQEWGITYRTLLGRRQLMYRDVEAFTYMAIRQYVNGSYSGTNITLRFVPRPGCGRAISHQSQIIGEDGELEKLRGAISQIIASQMHEQLKAGEQVAWTDNLAFHPEGLVYRPAGFISRGEPMLLPYANYHGYSLNDGYFFLFEKGKEKHILSESVGEENFFPGFFLLLTLAHANEEAAPE